ncbi:MAG: hypothetical protein U9R66_05325 [Thermodesulfobacteriota bacterium]|nr:hypothetical protein [Thermodesulfobacteriota bacterium]
MPGFKRKFTNSHTLACKDLGVLDILDKPTGCGKQLIYFFLGREFRRS